MEWLSLLFLGLAAGFSPFIIKKVISVLDALLIRKQGNSPNFLLFRVFWTDSIKDYIPYLGPAFIINIFIGEVDQLSQNVVFWIRQSVWVFIIILIIFLLNKVIYNISQLPEVENLPNYLGIKIVLEAMKLILYLVAGILIIAYLTKQSPLSILSALGALTAVLMLVFRDTILGLASGIQISANKMLKIGDWIEIPSCKVDGIVLEIKLTTIRIQNWDKSIINLPAYSLVQNSFKNWQNMIGSGARRIKRSIFLDATKIRFLTPAEINKKIPSFLIKKTFLQERLKTTRKSQPQYKITNAELFRAYIGYYLRHHPDINQDLTLMVRQLQPASKGIPLEIYAFSKKSDWVLYETIQTEIFEHLYAKATEFGLEVFQDPTSKDFSQLTNNNI